MNVNKDVTFVIVMYNICKQRRNNFLSNYGNHGDWYESELQNVERSFSFTKPFGGIIYNTYESVSRRNEDRKGTDGRGNRRS